ncbi:unnamed protein product, partial [Strongylus vulgaris]
AQLAELLQHKSELFYRKFGGGGGLRVCATRPSTSAAKISGTLITHLHEHSDKVTQSVFSLIRTNHYPVSSVGWASNEILAMAVGDGHVIWTDIGEGDIRVVTKVCFVSCKIVILYEQ